MERIVSEDSTGVVECVNCGHLLWRSYKHQPWEHFTRNYHRHGYPYTTVRCRAGHLVDGFKRKEGCKCENPQPKLTISTIRGNG